MAEINAMRIIMIMILWFCFVVIDNHLVEMLMARTTKVTMMTIDAR